jgi:DNA-directed RNA polymerase subunit M/transcription elongation factor TFIIS
MSHIYIAAMNAALAKKLARVCAKCGTKLTVQREQRNETVRCTSCGADVPPNAESASAR